MSLIFIISIIFLFLSLFLPKKTNKKLNGLISSFYILLIIFFLTSLEAFILSYLNIKNTLFTFSLFNTLISATLFFTNHKKNGKKVFQKYYFDKKQIISASIILIFCLIIGYIRFDGFTVINYKVNDAAVHYKLSTDYNSYLKLFDKGYSDELYNFGRTMFGYYVPCGLFMRIMPIPHYSSYDLFNTVIFALISLGFYITCLTIKKNEKNSILTLIVVFLYTLAYPLNYLIFGFGYLGCGILAVNLIFLTWKFILKYENIILYIPLFLFNIGLFYSYYLFAPAVFLSEGLFMIYRFIKEKYNIKEFFRFCFLCLIVPTIFGFLYFVYNKTGSKAAINGYSIDGYSYKNLYSNFIVLTPTIIYSIINKFKKKEIDFSIFFFICLTSYIIFTLFFTESGKVSAYYFFKSYNILWFIIYVLIYELINHKHYNLILKVNFGFVIVLIIAGILNIDGLISKVNFNMTNSAMSKELSSIYIYNYEKFNNESKISHDEVKLISEVLKYSDKCKIKKKNDELPYINGYTQRLWFYAINKIVPSTEHKDKSPVDIFTDNVSYNSIINNKKIRCILINDDYAKEKYNNEIKYEDYNVLYENKKGKLLIKK